MAPRRVTSTQELESRLLSERPVAAPVEKMPMSRAEAMARPAAQSAPKAASAMSAPLCGFCGLPVTDHATEYEGPEGELRAKHEDCHAFQHRGMRQPGDDT